MGSSTTVSVIDEQDVYEEHYIINISTGVPHREEGISSDNQGDFPHSLPDCLQITVDDNSLGIAAAVSEHNILVSYRIVSQEYADVLKTPNDYVAPGRKRPLRIRSKEVK